MSNLIDKLARQFFVGKQKNRSQSHPTLPAPQSHESQVDQKISPARSVPHLRTSAEQVAQARARTMQGAKSEFAKLMEELNQSANR